MRSRNITMLPGSLLLIMIAAGLLGCGGTNGGGATPAPPDTSLEQALAEIEGAQAPADVDAALQQFCDDMFGSVSGDMYNYFTTVEELYRQMHEDIERKLFRWYSQFVLDAAEWQLARQCRGHLHRYAR